MLARVISSLQHPIVKKICKLKTDSKFRKEENLVPLTGDTIISEVSRSQEIALLLYIEDTTFKDQIKAKEKISVTSEILEKCLGYKSKDTCIALVSVPQSLNLYPYPWLALDTVQDPGNLGTLFRSALAFGFKTIFLLSDSCDPFNDKALKSARGSTFLLEIHQIDYANFIQLIKEKKVEVLFADAKGTLMEKFSFKRESVLVLGNEGHGVNQIIQHEGKPLAIKMTKDCESLNVAIAGSIIMSQMSRGIYG